MTPAKTEWRPMGYGPSKLAEGLIWDFHLKKLLFVDILSNKLIRLDIFENSIQSWEFCENVCWVQLTQYKGRYILGLHSGVVIFESEGACDLIWITKSFPHNNLCRLNDSYVDYSGLLWMGSMSTDNPIKKIGQLASLDSNLNLKIHDSAYGITNGPITSLDGKTLYHNDSLSGVIYCYDLKDAFIFNKRVFCTFGGKLGYPDGMCLDSDGSIWVAMWGVGIINKLDQSGKVIQSFSIPAPNVSNVCFGGHGLDRLFVSTATVDLNDLELAENPYSGRIFEIINHGSIGIHANCFKI